GADALAPEGEEGGGDLQGIGPAGGLERVAEQAVVAGGAVVVGVEVGDAQPGRGGEVGGVAGEEHAGGGGLPGGLVQVEGDGVGSLQACEQGAQPVREQGAPAVGGVDVEPHAVAAADAGDL